jgi:hypothetical protein
MSNDDWSIMNWKKIRMDVGTTTPPFAWRV